MADLESGGYPLKNDKWLLNGSPAVTVLPRESVDRRDVTSDVAGVLVSGEMLSVAIPVQAGDVINDITFVSGATAAGTPTHYWFALYNEAGNLISQTADQTTAAWAAGTAKKLALPAPYVVESETILYAAICVVATTVPSLVCNAVALAFVSGALITGQVVRAQISGTGLTTTAPATIASPTTTANVPYAVLTNS